MSTYQQSGGPEGQPGYAQPQDPWAGGFEPGQASVPTDPIPQQYDPYGGYPPGDQWQTVPQSGYPGYPPPRRSRALPIAITVVIVLLLGSGAGYAAWYVATTNRPAASPTTPAVAPTTPGGQATTPGGGGTSPAGFDAHTVVEGDCLVNNGTPDDPAMQVVPCNTPKSYKVIRVRQGADIPEGPDGKFDRDTTSVTVCKDTNYESWYAYDDEDNDAKDVFFCMTNNP